MKTYSYIILFGGLVFACCKQQQKTIIEKEKMINLITEVSLAESYAETYVLKDSSLNKDSVLKQELSAVYKVNSTTADQFASSYKYYSGDPKLFKEIIDSAHARAYRNKDRIYLSTTVK